MLFAIQRDGKPTFSRKKKKRRVQQTDKYRYLADLAKCDRQNVYWIVHSLSSVNKII